jgi:hypothetical protein
MNTLLATRFVRMKAVMWMLLILSATVALAQTPETIFPDDMQDPIKAGGAELLQVVCPGKVVVNGKKEMVCNVPCASFTGFENEPFEWQLYRVIRGHFLSPTSDDIALAMRGCEPHSYNFGGTILLAKRSGKWDMQWYKGGVPTETCHAARLENGREILVCIGTFGGQGMVSTDLYVEDLLNPTPALMAGRESIFSVFDNTETCGYNFEDESKPVPLVSDEVKRVTFVTHPDGTLRGLSVFGRKGERKMTRQDEQVCNDQRNPNKPHKHIDIRPRTTPYRVDFAFDGKTFRRLDRK